MKRSVAEATPPEIKVVGRSGQISLGKRYAGKVLQLQYLEEGSILLTSVAVVPESQLWTLQEPDRSRIARGLAWAAEHPAQETRVEDLKRPSARRPGKRGK